MKESKQMNFEEVHELRRRRKMYGAILLACLVAYLFCLIGAWIVLRSPLFRVRSVVVEGNSAVPSGDVLDAVRSTALRGSWPGVKALLGFTNILAWPKGLTDGDLALLPGVKSITLERNFESHIVVIHVVERKPYGIWCPDQGGCWWFDDSGTLFSRAIEASGAVILVVHDHSQANFVLRSKILPDAFVRNIFSIFEVVKASGLNVENIALNDLSLQEIEADVSGGPKMYFSLRFPANNDLAAIQSLASKPGFNSLQYLDFRVENRVYYK